MRSPQQCSDRYELLLAAFHDSRAQLPAPASRAAGPPAALPQRAPPGASPASAAAGATDSVSAGLKGPVPPAESALARVVVSAAGISPGQRPQSLTLLQAAAAAASPQPSPGQHLAPGSRPQQSAAPGPSSSAQQTQQQHQHLSNPLQVGTVPAPSTAASGQGSGQASLSVGAAHMHDMQPRIGPAWSLSSELQTLREHLAWLASSNIVCGIAVSLLCSRVLSKRTALGEAFIFESLLTPSKPNSASSSSVLGLTPSLLQGVSAVTSAAAMSGQMSAEGSAAGPLSEVLAELHSLPRNGQLRSPGTMGPKALHRSNPGTPVQVQPLQVGRYKTQTSLRP